MVFGATLDRLLHLIQWLRVLSHVGSHLADPKRWSSNGAVSLVEHAASQSIQGDPTDFAFAPNGWEQLAQPYGFGPENLVMFEVEDWEGNLLLALQFLSLFSRPSTYEAKIAAIGRLRDVSIDGDLRDKRPQLMGPMYEAYVYLLLDQCRLSPRFAEKGAKVDILVPSLRVAIECKDCLSSLASNLEDDLRKSRIKANEGLKQLDDLVLQGHGWLRVVFLDLPDAVTRAVLPSSIHGPTQLEVREHLTSLDLFGTGGKRRVPLKAPKRVVFTAMDWSYHLPPRHGVVTSVPIMFHPRISGLSRMHSVISSLASGLHSDSPPAGGHVVFGQT